MLNLKELKSVIINSTDSLDEITDSLKKITEPTVFLGTGGSRVVAEYAALVLKVKNKINTRCLDPRDLRYVDLTSYPNLFIVSSSGANFGVKSSFCQDKNIYLFSKRKSKIKQEELLHYEMPHIHSFISLETTIIPMSILLKYYLGDKFGIILNELFSLIDESITFPFKGDLVNIFTGADTFITSTFLETSLIESGLKIPVIHEKYSYCHGRSTLNKTRESSAIYLRYFESDLDKTIIKVLSRKSVPLVLASKFSDPLIDEFYLTLQCMYLLNNVAAIEGLDLANIKYDVEAVRELYHFKGSM